MRISLPTGAQRHVRSDKRHRRWDHADQNILLLRLVLHFLVRVLVPDIIAGTGAGAAESGRRLAPDRRRRADGMAFSSSSSSSSSLPSSPPPPPPPPLALGVRSLDSTSYVNILAEARPIASSTYCRGVTSPCRTSRFPTSVGRHGGGAVYNRGFFRATNVPFAITRPSTEASSSMALLTIRPWPRRRRRRRRRRRHRRRRRPAISSATTKPKRTTPPAWTTTRRPCPR